MAKDERREIVTVKTKFQVVIPQRIREQVHIGIGDLLEARVENGTIMLTPKGLVDKEIAEALADYSEGRTHGPYDTVREAIAALEHRAASKQKRRK